MQKSHSDKFLVNLSFRLMYPVLRKGLGLSNEQFFIIITQGASKLWPVKVEGPKWNLKFLIWGWFYKVNLTQSDSTRPGVTPLFWTSNFDRSYACSSLSFVVNSSSFESPKLHLLQHWLRNSITALLRYVILA